MLLMTMELRSPTASGLILPRRMTKEQKGSGHSQSERKEGFPYRVKNHFPIADQCTWKRHHLLEVQTPALTKAIKYQHEV